MRAHVPLEVVSSKYSKDKKKLNNKFGIEFMLYRAKIGYTIFRKYRRSEQHYSGTYIISIFVLSSIKRN